MELPFSPTGGYEDLISLIVRLEYRLLDRDQSRLPNKPAWQRRFLEFPLNLIGAAVALLQRLLPNALSLKTHLKVYGILTNYKYQSLGIENNLELKNAFLIYNNLKNNHNVPVLCLTSHPPVEGELRDLNVGLMATGSLAIKRVAGTKRPCRVLVAVDSMALDTLSVIEEGLYAGVMGLYDLGVDRYPMTRSWPQRLLFRRLHYERSAFRLAESLRKGENVVLVISGGVNTTARLLYTIREFLWTLRKQTKRSPEAVISELASRNAVFSRFNKDYGSRLSPWRSLDTFFTAWLAGDPIIASVSRETTAACESGILTPDQSQALFETVRAFGNSPEDAEKLLADFKLEFARITPYRLRFFKFLLERVLPRVGAILLQPVDHSEDPADPMQLKEPVGILMAKDGFTAISVSEGVLRKENFKDASFFRSWMRSAFAR